ncbi:MAG: helix-turn-helix domain-containing protein [Anaerolineaceae bacterium]|nr:helix-turn-helix domain-containing protein [Anaerolineaceae bacterium]
MPSSKADLLLHPVRFRILTAISTSRMTAGEIAVALPDIPQTTLYRHINALLEAGMLKVVEEKPIRGTIERTYALTGMYSLNADDLHDMSRQECEQVYTMFLSSLMRDAQNYLDSKPADARINPLQDGVEIDKVLLFLDDEEFARMNKAILQLMMEAAQNQPRQGRQRRVFSYLFIPAGDVPKNP